MHHSHLVDILLHGEVNLGDTVGVQLRSSGDDCDDLRDVLLTNMMVGKSEGLDYCVDVPLLGGCIFLTDLANLVRKFFFEF